MELSTRASANGRCACECRAHCHGLHEGEGGKIIEYVELHFYSCFTYKYKDTYIHITIGSNSKVVARVMVLAHVSSTCKLGHFAVDLIIILMYIILYITLYIHHN